MRITFCAYIIDEMETIKSKQGVQIPDMVVPKHEHCFKDELSTEGTNTSAPKPCEVVVCVLKAARKSQLRNGI